MKFSLVLATVGRHDEVARFLASLNAQGYRHFELIVVDQNDDDRLVPLLRMYGEKFALQHVRSARGLSRARNVGLKLASGDVVAFPDDDCWYPAGLLEHVAAVLKADPELDGITGRFTDGDGRSEGKWLKRSMMLNRYNVWHGATSITIFLRRPVVESVRQFNESLGVGAGTIWGSAEETDFLLRALQHGHKLKFMRDLIVYHPVKTASFDESARNRQKKYEVGTGHVIRLNDYPFWYFPVICLRAFVGMVRALGRGNFLAARFKYVSVMARIRGWRGQ